MLSLLFVLVLLGLGGYFVWKAWNGETFDWKTGLAGLAGLGVAVYEWFHGVLNGLF